MTSVAHHSMSGLINRHQCHRSQSHKPGICIPGIRS